MEKEKHPLMYLGWLIKPVTTPNKGVRLSAYNFRTDKFINPLYSDWEHLKMAIDAVELIEEQSKMHSIDTPGIPSFLS